MIGITKALEADLKAQGHSDADIGRLFDPYGHHGEVRVRYDRGGGDLTSALPSSRHMSYVAKGWTAVALENDAPAAASQPIDVPADIQAYGRADRVGVWTRGGDSQEISCKHAAAMLSKGWSFSGLADDGRRRKSAESRVAAEASGPVAAQR